MPTPWFLEDMHERYLEWVHDIENAPLVEEYSEDDPLYDLNSRHPFKLVKSCNCCPKPDSIAE